MVKMWCVCPLAPTEAAPRGQPPQGTRFAAGHRRDLVARVQQVRLQTSLLPHAAHLFLGISPRLGLTWDLTLAVSPWDVCEGS